MKKAVTTLIATMFLLMTVLSTTPSQAVVVPSITWLPPLTNQDLFQLKDGSTLPIKFSLLNPDGSFVADTSVEVAVNRVLFRDDFEGYSDCYDGSPDWGSQEYGDWHVTTVSGNKIFEASSVSPNRGTAIFAGDDSWANYILEAKIWTDDTYWGLIYHADAAGTTYYDAYLNTAEGKIEIWKHTSGIWGRSNLVKQTPVGGPAISADTWYRMRVEVNENNIKVFFALDGESYTTTPQAEYTDTTSPYTLGRIGLLFYDISGPSSHVGRFDSVMVLDPEPVKTFLYGTGDDNVRIYGSEGALSLLSEDFDTTATGNDPTGWEEYGLGTWTVDKDSTAPSQGSSGYGDVYCASASSTTWTRDFSFITVASDFSDGVFEFQFKLLTDATPTPRITIPVRYQDDSNWILFDVDTGVFRTGYYIWVATTAGGWVQLAGKNFAITKDVWHSMKIVLDEWNYEMWIDGVQELTASDTVQAFRSGKIGLGVYRDTHAHFDDVSLMVGYYIANLHTKELALPEGEYAITVWYQGVHPIQDTYVFELADNVQGTGRGKGQA